MNSTDLRELRNDTLCTCIKSMRILVSKVWCLRWYLFWVRGENVVALRSSKNKQTNTREHRSLPSFALLLLILSKGNACRPRGLLSLGFDKAADLDGVQGRWPGPERRCQVTRGAAPMEVEVEVEGGGVMEQLITSRGHDWRVR